MEQEKRVRVIAGHYGSGKTEFAVNYALSLARRGIKTALADLDIVNPYFRSREKWELLQAAGVRLVDSSVAHAADLPALSPELFTLFQDPSYTVVLDMGGDEVGARVLSRFHPYLDREPAELWLVLNANRAQTARAEGALEYLRAIQASAHQPVTGLINNTHLCSETTAEDLRRGDRLVRAVSEASGVPVRYRVGLPALLEEAGPLAGEPFPIQIYMKKPWE